MRNPIGSGSVHRRRWRADLGWSRRWHPTGRVENRLPGATVARGELEACIGIAEACIGIAEACIGIARERPLRCARSRQRRYFHDPSQSQRHSARWLEFPKPDSKYVYILASAERETPPLRALKTAPPFSGPRVNLRDTPIHGSGPRVNLSDTPIHGSMPKVRSSYPALNAAIPSWRDNHRPWRQPSLVGEHVRLAEANAGPGVTAIPPGVRR
jgi:hypothetical protein